MASFEGMMDLLSPFLIHLQEMQSELTCGKCSKLLINPKLLLCNHVFCSYCLAPSKDGSYCFTCKSPFLAGDLKPSIFVQKMVSIFISMDAAIAPFMKIGSQDGVSGTTGTKMAIKESLILDNKGVQDISKNMLRIDIGQSDTMQLLEPYSGSACKKDPGDKYNGQVKHSKKNILTPNYSSKNNINAVTNMGIVVGQPANHLSDQAQNSGTLSDTMKNRLTVGRKEESREPKRQKLNRNPNKTKPLDAPIECAFCHSFRSTEGSGPLQHYLKGKEVTSEEANQTKVIHVHYKCLLWAPQVYNQDETIFGLEKELARSSKLKCRKCGQKGAALGCYFKDCQKTYHVPCAYQITGGRWGKHFDFLCPLHTSQEMPGDSPNRGVNIETKDSSSAQLEVCDTVHTKHDFDGLPTATVHASCGLVLCGSDLSTSENELMDKFANLTGATVIEGWEKSVTHVIASTNNQGACSRTFKVLMAILSGKWVLKTAWVKAYMEAKHPVAEEPHEISLDVHGNVDGPRKGRLRAMKKEPKIFAGLKFYLIGHFTDLLKNMIDKLVIAAGGTILDRDGFLRRRNSNARGSTPTSYVVYQKDPAEEGSSVDPDEVLRMREAEAFAANVGAQVICHTWIFDAIAASSLEFS